MDVYGKNPDSEAGKYFRANIWSWRPIHDLIYQLCSNLLDEEILEGMGYNGGVGPEDAATCKEMASRFERWMEHNAQGHEIDTSSDVVPVVGPTRAGLKRGVRICTARISKRAFDRTKSN